MNCAGVSHVLAYYCAFLGFVVGIVTGLWIAKGDK